MNDESLQLGDNAIRILRRRYLIRRDDGEGVETPAQMFGRVASAVAQAERMHGADDEAEAVAEAFYRSMARGVFLPNSPTLMNAGRDLGMLSACFVLPVPDSVEGIFESVKHAALIQKAGGGTGFAFDRLRPAGDYISSSGGKTSGPISFWRVFAAATCAIQQGAFRRGANMGMMGVRHPDILKFITAKADPGAFENFNISVKVGEDFMKALAEAPGRPHVVVNPRTRRRYVIPRGVEVATYALSDLADADGPATPCWTVGEVWDLIVRCAHGAGEPGLCFIDRVNADNPTPHLGPIEATNPCGEQPLLDHEACTLGSVNLARCVRAGAFDDGAFARAVRLGVRFLDDIVDVSDTLVELIRAMTRGNRKIGLGVMGFADALMMLGISYDSDEAIALGRRVARRLTEEAFAASEALARQRGCFPNYAGSVWQTRHGRPMRNAAVTTVAPTGTISILAGCSGGIEPAFALAFARNVMEGDELLEVNPVFRAMMTARGLWSDDLPARLARGEPLEQIADVPADLRRVFVTAHEVPPARHVAMQAAFQEFIDGAISKTINLPADATQAAVGEAFLQAWRSGCKGITVYRDGSRPAQPMARARPAGQAERCPRCHAGLDLASGCGRCPHCGCVLCA